MKSTNVSGTYSFALLLEDKALSITEISIACNMLSVLIST
jgi:hypothetical protein